MVVVPVILLWSIYFLIRGKAKNIDKNKWFTGAFVSLMSSIIAIPLIYYFYTNAFGIESLIVDILILLVALTIGQLLGIYVYKHGKGINAKVSFSLMIVVFAVFIVFTFVTPRLPIFMDGPTGSYGL